MRTWKSYLCLALLCVLTLGLAFGSPVPRSIVAELAQLVFGAAGLVAALRAAREPGIARRARLAWSVMTAGFAVVAGTGPVLMMLPAHGMTGAHDAAHVAVLIVLLIAVQLFPPAVLDDRRGRWKSALDSLTVLVGSGMLLWYTAVGPYVSRHGVSGRVLLIVAGYPLADLALLVCVARLLLRGAISPNRGSLRLLGASVAVLFGGDVVHSYLHGQGRLMLHSPWQSVCWMAGGALLVAAAVAQRDTGTATAGARLGRSATRYLPYGAIALAHLLVLVAAVREHSFYPWGGLAVGGALLTAIVLGRQVLVQRESDERAVTDGLTGLANRARVRAHSVRALARAERTGRHTAVLVLDMNNFKQVNDTLGHRSGDLVLLEFARVLRRCVAAPGLPARLGGDEFAVVLPELDSPEQAYEVAGRIAASVAPVIVNGHVVSMAASIGVAVSAPGELTHDALVHRADLAMYRAKRMSSETRWAAWRESDEPAAQDEPSARAA